MKQLPQKIEMEFGMDSRLVEKINELIDFISLEVEEKIDPNPFNLSHSRGISANTVPPQTTERKCMCHAHYDSLDRRQDGEKIPIAPFDPDCAVHGKQKKIEVDNLVDNPSSSRHQENDGWEEKWDKKFGGNHYEIERMKNMKAFISQTLTEERERLAKDSITIAEQIVIDYANLSGRESANRAEFRKLTIEHLQALLKDNKK